jgi:stage V sporulation protein SpoVS
MIDKYGEKKEKELRNLVYRGAFKLSNGDIILNAEEFFVTQVYMSYGMGGVWSTIYNYYDIVALRIKEDGTLVWARNINKAQTLDGGKESFSSFAFNDKNYLLINCSDEVKQLSNNRIQFKQKRSKKTNLYAIVLDAEGNFTHQEIVDGDVNQMPFAVARGVLTKNGNELILVGRNNKNKQLIKVSATD